MNKITVAVFSSLLVGILVMPGFGFAQNQPVKVAADSLEVKSVGLLPTSPFYFLKEASRGIQSFFTFDQVKKAELKLRFADEKLVEAKTVSEQEPQNETAIKKAFDNYESNAAELKARLEGLSSKSENPNVQKLLEKVAVREIKHKELFEMLTLKPEIKNNFPRLVSLLPEKTPESKGIKVISPIGGEKWMIGKTYLIKWQVKPALTAITPVDIYLDKGIECFTVPCENRLEIAKNISSDTQYSWTVPLNLSSFPRARIFIEAVGNREQFGISHYFSIVSSANQISKTLTGFLEASGQGFQMWGTHKLSVKEVVYCVKAPCPPIEKSYLVKAANDEVLKELKKYEGKNVSITGEAKYYDIEGGFWGIVAGSVTTNFVDLKMDLQYGADNNSVFVSASIKGDSQNKKVNYWKANIDCDSGIIVSDKNDENLCGTEKILYGSAYYDVTQDILIWTVGVKNKLNTKSAAVFSLVAYDLNGNDLGGDKESVWLGTQSVSSKGDIKIISPNGGEKWEAGETYKIIWKAPESVKTVFINLDTGIRCFRAPCPEAGFNIAKNIPASDESYSWTIPLSFGSHPKAQIVVTDSSKNSSISGKSGYFSIVGTPN